jgi:mono/diheme cytochrome c family protein
VCLIACGGGTPGGGSGGDAAGVGVAERAHAPGPGRAEALGPEEARAGRAAGPELLREGEHAYRLYCAGCHGERGDGRGPAARFLDPKPRDFTQGLYKFASVPAGGLPRDEDLMRTLARGLPGSSMPSWQFLPEGERRALVAYVKTFSTAFAERAPAAPVAVSEDPYGDRDPGRLRAAIDRGAVVYHVLATCWQCHAAYEPPEAIDRMAQAEESPVDLRPDADRPLPVDDAWGDVLVPTEFTTQRLKNGSAVADIYRTVAAGVGGTAMPTWKDALEESDLWALAYYVKSLADRRWWPTSAVPSQPPPAGPAGAGQTGAR